MELNRRTRKGLSLSLSFVRQQKKIVFFGTFFVFKCFFFPPRRTARPSRERRRILKRTVSGVAYKTRPAPSRRRLHSTNSPPTDKVRGRSLSLSLSFSLHLCVWKIPFCVWPEGWMCSSLPTASHLSVKWPQEKKERKSFKASLFIIVLVSITVSSESSLFESFFFWSRPHLF